MGKKKKTYEVQKNKGGGLPGDLKKSDKDTNDAREGQLGPAKKSPKKSKAVRHGGLCGEKKGETLAPPAGKGDWGQKHCKTTRLEKPDKGGIKGHAGER